MGQRALHHPRPLSRPGGRGVSRSAGRGEGSFPQGLRRGLPRLAGPLTGLGSESSDWLTSSTNLRYMTLGDGSLKPEESNA